MLKSQKAKNSWASTHFYWFLLKKKSVPSDHWVPLCVLHTDSHNPPARQYKIIISRPLPESKVCQFGQWLTRETLDSIRDADPPSEQVKVFEGIMQDNLNKHFPLKTTRIGVGELPHIWVTGPRTGKKLTKCHFYGRGPAGCGRHNVKISVYLSV